jgi:hypothetical protein
LLDLAANKNSQKGAVESLLAAKAVDNAMMRRYGSLS